MGRTVKGMDLQHLSQLQFQPGGHNLSFSDPNNPSMQMQNIQLAGGAPQLLLQQQQQNFPNLNVNFLTEQMGVGQILQPPSGNQAQSMSMQNLITPMSVALGGGVNFAQSANIQAQSATSQASQQAKQRVFTGTVTKTHDNFGFIDEEVFFQMSVVKGVVLPKPGDRVLVEADFNPAMPFKWNATRVQIVNIGGLNSSLPNMNLNPGGKPQSPQPMSHGSQSASMLSQHSSASSAANMLNMNFNQNHSGNQKNSQSAQNSQSGLSSSGHSQGPQQSQAGNPRYQSGSNPVSIVSNPHSAYGVRNNSRPEDNSRAHPGARPQRARPPPPPVSAPPPPMVSLASMDPHSVPHIQLPLPLQLPLSVPLQLPSLLQLDRDVDKLDRERDIRDRERDRDRDRERLEREKEHDRRERERERERSLEREKEREKERERDYERKREREREREREKQKRLKDEVKRDRDKDRDRDKRDSPARSIRNRSPIQLIRESRKRSRSRSKGRDKDKEVRDRSKSRSTSPKRLPVVLRDRPTPRYGWELPRTALDVIDVSVMELKRRYRNLYIPSDFILARCCWQETFPLHHPMELSPACPIHIFRRHTEKIELAEVSFKLKSKEYDSTPVMLNPPDENESLKVKVVLLSLPNKTTLYRKACGLAEDPSDSSLQHPNRLINFVVGTKMAKNETMIIGGSWSPSLDGPNPESDPQVLIRTAIRTTRALTGIDLRRCTKWYRFMELYYRRGNGNVETVIVLLPNIWTALPSRREWEDIQKAYKQVFVGADSKDSKSPAEERKGDNAADSSPPNFSQSKDLPMVTNPTEDDSRPNQTSSVNGNSSGADQSHGERDSKSEGGPRVPFKSEAELEQASVSEDSDLKSTRKKPEEDDIYGDLLPAAELPITDDFDPGDLSIKMDIEEQTSTEISSTELAMEQSKLMEKEEAPPDTTIQDTRIQAGAVSASSTNSAPPETAAEEQVGGADTPDEAISANLVEEGKGTHFSLLDPKHMTVQKLREEMELRGATTKGLKKNQLVTRLAKILKTEESTESTTKVMVNSKNDSEEGLMDESIINDENPDDMETEETLVTTGINGVDSVHTTEPIKLSDSASTATEIKSKSEGLSRTLDEDSTGVSLSQKSDGREILGLKIEEDSVIHESGQHDPECNQLDYDCNKSVQQNRLKKAGITYLVPILPEGTNEKTRKVWERRYSLPKTPNLLVHPSREAKSGIFDCNQHSLNTLRDYRLADNKEQSFEVSLCSEFFNEMLQRDFAFRIYRELVYQANTEDKEEKISTVPVVTKDESPVKKRKISTSSSITGIAATTKSKTVDPHLLLAFIFFDHTRCGYITDSDLEDLCLSLGLGLSRSQVRKLVQKVCTKGSLHYRKWTDVQVEDGVVVAEPRDDTQNSSSSLLSQGIKASLPTFGKAKLLLDIQDIVISSEDGDALAKETQSLLAACDSDPSLVDVTKLRDQLEKNEKDRMTLDTNIKLLKSSLNETKVQALELKKVNGGLKDELLRVKETVKKYETTESSALSDLDVLKKVTERFIERVKDLVKLPAVANKEKDSKSKDVAKKDKVEIDNDSSSMES
ncbi:unnamed protein product [Allacma fusca]|uniref:DBC1/CARP1 catalytically inactive NUDIX hydrolase domain-containing protein n=1 Tax=Allacma fusca TaxID=39272 RepID=A0A8J2JNP7_9HEXA|nr:unnamed protein product [Allacma fusca]